MHDEFQSTQGDEPSQHIRFFSSGAFTRQHIFAIAAKPFVDFGTVGESFGIGRRREGLNGFVGAGMSPTHHGRFAMAAGALPLLTVVGFEKCFTAGCIGRLARLRGVTRQQLSRRGRRRMKRGEQQQREQDLTHGFEPFKTDASGRVLGFS